MRRCLFLFSVLLLLARVCGAESPTDEQEPQFLAQWTEYSSDDIYYGDLLFLTFYFENCGRENIVIPQSQIPRNGWGAYEYAELRLHNADGLLPGFPHRRAYSLRNALLKPAERGDEAFLWRPGRDIQREALGVSAEYYLRAKPYYLKPGERHVQGFLPIWIPSLDDLEGQNATRLKSELQDGKQVFACFDRPGDLCKPFSAEHEKKLATLTTVDPMPYGFEEIGAYDWEDGIDVHKIIEHGYVSLAGDVPWSDLPEHPLIEKYLQIHTLTVRPRPQEELELLREWFMLFPETCDRPEHFNGAVFPRPAQFSPADRGEAGDEKIELFKSRTPEVEKRIARHKELETQLLERAGRKDSTITRQMQEFIVLRGYLVGIKYATGKKEVLNTYMELLDCVLASKNRELWISYLEWIVLYSGERHRTDVVPDEAVDLFSHMLRFRIATPEPGVRSNSSSRR